MTTEQNNDMLDSMVANDALQTDNCNDMGANVAMGTCAHAGECGNSGNCGSACSGGCDNCGCGFVNGATATCVVCLPRAAVEAIINSTHTTI